MRTAGAVLVVAAAVTVAGCGGASHARRDAVNQYFDRVQVAQAPLRVEAAPIEQAFGRFSTVRNSKMELRALVHAQAVLERVHAKVQRIQPPADARHVHADIVHLYGLQAGVAGELIAMAHFVPRYDSALAPLKPAHVQLASDLKATKGWKKIAHAFERYRLSIAAVLAEIDHLSAPPTMRPAFNAEREVLGRSVGLCASIETALAKHSAKKTSAGIRALTGLGTEKAVVRAQRNQIAAAKAYNTRLARISSLTAKIADERNKLVGEVS
jgi:hypothetical protein